MSLNSEIDKLLSEFGLSMVNDTRSNLQKKLDARSDKARAKSKISGGRFNKPTSRLWASLQDNVIYSNEGVKLVIRMNDYWDVVDGGRKAGNVSEDGQRKIGEWADTRGLAENIRISDLEKRKEKQKLSKRKEKLKVLKKMPFDRAKKAAGFLVARSLKNKTIEPTNFFSEVVSDGRVKELESKLRELIKTDFKIFVTNGIN